MNVESTISRSHAWIRQEFEAWMHSSGFTCVPAEELIPSKDASLLFTNSTTVPLKPFVLGQEDAGKGVYCSQPCLRFQSLQDYECDLKTKTHYNMFFNMLGGFVPLNSSFDITAELYHFLSSLEGVTPSSIAIHCREQDLALFPTATSCGDIVLDHHNPSFYEWSYGIDGIKGVGISFVMQMQNKREENLGQVIGIIQQGKLIGYEFGFGIETLIFAKQSAKQLLDCSEHRIAMNYTPTPAFMQLLDVSFAMVLILDNHPEVYHQNAKHGSVYNRLVRHIARLLVAEEISLFDISSTFDACVKYIGLSNDVAGRAKTYILTKVEQYDRNMEEFMLLYQELIQEVKANACGPKKAQRKLRAQATSWPVLPEILNQCLDNITQA